ncbi:MAG: PilZ domain-containing protein [candidate division Zixibacteria bacterium]|nr:PilZ domain-containing protein [candidate division Zixibacteria bacterium]
MEENRKQKRMHVISYLKVQEQQSSKDLGQVVNMSSEGMGLYSDEPLESDSMVKLKLTLPTDSNENYELAFDARVAWCRQSVLPGYYDSGVQLIDVPSDELGILEEFIEASAIEDRWLMADETESHWHRSE